MTHQEFSALSKDLQSLAKSIPLDWGEIQNDKVDGLIEMFKIHSYIQLETQIKHLPENSKNYFRRRWFLWKCAQCDEHLFSVSKNVSPNPNSRDQTYDIEFHNNSILRFDVKGTVIPKSFRNKVKAVVDNPSGMVNFFYTKQSKGVRDNIQNRLFIVHHSFRYQTREMYLRCYWDLKAEVFKEYSKKISTKSNFITYKNVIADVIFIFENEDKSFTYQFHAVE